MNWELFSPIGYASVALWFGMLLLWLMQFFVWRRPWLVHLALLVGVVSYLLAKTHSEGYVDRIHVDRTAEYQAQLARQERARLAAKAELASHAADVRFVEDAAGDAQDKGGLDEADLKFLESIESGATPAWKKEKKARTLGEDNDSLEAQIGAVEEQEQLEAEAFEEDLDSKPILMSEKDKRLADQLDRANLSVIRWLLGFGVILLVVDYVRRANDYRSAYLPLPLPSRWADALTPRASVTVRPAKPRRDLLAELRVFARRGESFVLITEDPETARQATRRHYCLPLWLGRVDVLTLTAQSKYLDDEFVFETLWFGRNSFVTESRSRAEALLERFIDLLGDRRAARARARQTFHIVWDTTNPLSAATLKRFANAAQKTGCLLLICRPEALLHADKEPCIAEPTTEA